jgi:carboxymethylenebutenolidase
MSQTTRKEHAIKTPDGIAPAWSYRPTGDAPVPAVILYIDAFLVRPTMHAMAERLAGLGYFVLLPNIFYRAGEVAPFDPHTAFGNPLEKVRLMGILTALTMDLAMRDAGAYLDAIESEKNVRGGGAGAVGYCLGGRLAVATAGHHPERLRAAASFHGGHLVTDAADSPHLFAEKMKASIYLGVADEDGSCTPEHQAALAKAFGAAHLSYEMELYKGKKHGFAVKDHGVYDEAAAARHWKRVETFFGEALA